MKKIPCKDKKGEKAIKKPNYFSLITYLQSFNKNTFANTNFSNQILDDIILCHNYLI